MITRAVVVLLVLLFAAACYLAWRLIATGGGQHAAPRWYTEGDERIALPCERAIPRAQTGHAPPWEDAPVIEPAAVTHGPPPRDVPGAWVLTAVISGGRVTELHGGIMPPADWSAGPVLPPWVTEVLGHDSAEDAVESMFTRAMARQVREITDGEA